MVRILIISRCQNKKLINCLLEPITRVNFVKLRIYCQKASKFTLHLNSILKVQKKMAKHLKANGTDIGADAEAILDSIAASKLKYPKPAATS